ncbi:MAG: hypothetical protein Q9190_006981 [Brigantiaea leucoxantha]
MINELANKVPTTLEYAQPQNAIKAWGFLCEQESEDLDVVSCFKLHLDPAFMDRRPDAPKLEDARKWFQDYLYCLHDHIRETFSNISPRWGSQKTEFIFSVPTTWKNPSMIAETERLVRRAGFGTDGPDHRTRIGLTEAEAAAVYASKQQYEKDDVILVCDAGGGTTDVNVLKIVSSRGEATRLQQLSWVEGRPIGSTQIDMKFHGMICERLDQIRNHLLEEPNNVAEKMMQGRFERFKCSYGTAASSSMPSLPLEVPGLPFGFSSANAQIENCMLGARNMPGLGIKIPSREDLRNVFNTQIDRILALTDEQLDRLSKKYPDLQVSWLVLSGGLGSSSYVKQCISSYYGSGIGSTKSNVKQMRTLTIGEPQLAVVQGLVMERIQTVSRGNQIFEERCCRSSYGIICMEEYNPNWDRHIGQKVILDQRDGKKWAVDQIQWFVKQGQNVSSNGVLRPFTIKIKPGQEDDLWQTHVVMSSAPTEQLPSNINQTGAERLCDVAAVLKDKGVDMKLKNRHWYNRGEKYFRLRFDVKVVLGAADLKFVLQTKDQRTISDGHDAIQVVWEAPRENAADKTQGKAAVYPAPDGP